MMIAHGYVRSLINTAQRDAREQVLRDMRREHPCPACNGHGIAPGVELTAAGFLDDASDCSDCDGSGIDYEDSEETVSPVTPADIKALRVSLGLSQDQFAAKLGVSPSTVEKWEQGQARPRGLSVKAFIDLRREHG